ncbi:MAG: AURKAIP1/COX24 domain-containing protein [bacterium]|nr:AURKAIP1/COX24 domain-containing protein [bacterium]
MSSVVKKRRKKIRKHKFKKLRKRTRVQRRRLGK